MEHFIRIAFWIVTLSVCLLAKPLPISELNIDLMREHVKCPPDAIFYTPTNVKDQCITAALECLAKELDTVLPQCSDTPDNKKHFIYQAIEHLMETSAKLSGMQGNVLKNSTECACETWNETPFDNFLNKMESLVQQANVALVELEKKAASVQQD